jgi:hypothetical protein
MAYGQPSAPTTFIPVRVLTGRSNRQRFDEGLSGECVKPNVHSSPESGNNWIPAVIQECASFGHNPCAGDAFLFRNHAGNRIKILLWDGTGVWLCQRRLLPEMIVQSALEQMDRIHQLQRHIAQIESRLTSISKNDHAMQALQSIPGIGLLTATAMVAKTDNFNEFKSSRQFSAWLSLTLRQTGTGGRIRQLGVSKRGDAYLRTLLMHGARAIIARRTHSDWGKSLLERRPYAL